MNCKFERMNRLLVIILFLFSSIFSWSQTGYLFVKKGFKKKKDLYGRLNYLPAVATMTVYDME